MIERRVGPEKIVGVRIKDGIVTNLNVLMADGSTQAFVPEISQPAPVTHYIGKHEKLSGGYKHGRTGTQSE